MLIGYMRVSSENDRKVLDLQYDALIQEGIDPCNIYQDKASSAYGNREGLQKALSSEKMIAIREALNSGTNKTVICRTFNIKVTTLYDNLNK